MPIWGIYYIPASKWFTLHALGLENDVVQERTEVEDPYKRVFIETYYTIIISCLSYFK